MIARNALRFAAIASLGALGACTAAQVGTANRYQAEIAGACAVAMKLAPIAGQVAPWIVGGCATEAAIAKLALDPNSLAWVEGLAVKVKAKGS